jgi:glycosyltransferase involved in cell wall biosynthesis
MITIIYPYRNRETTRIRRSLDSLAQQKKQNFEVVFIDYGSKKEIASEIKKIVEEFSFCTYHYLFSEFQPWNKSKALNFVIKNLQSDYCLVADVDMIFHSDFTTVMKEHCSNDKVTYFQVGFLSEQESKKEKSFEKYKINFLSNRDATGISLFPVHKLKEIRGFDEVFHFWGAEDTDVHNRLKNAGCEVHFYDKETMVLHQWHFNYRRRETKKLNAELQLSGIVEFNNQHMKQNLKNRTTTVNKESWGNVISESDFDKLKDYPVVQVSNKRENVDYFLFHELALANECILAIQIKNDPVENSIKYKLKKYLGKKVPQFYTLKEVNDRILQHMISFYHTKAYIYKIEENLKSVVFKIKF